MHFVISYSSSNEQKTYINGELVSIDNVLGTIDYCPGGQISIGLEYTGRTYGFQGKLDDVGLWDRVLSQAEVAQLYNGIIDTVSPTVSLSHNASPTTTVSNGDSVTVTATFKVLMYASNANNQYFRGQATNVAMSATASSAIWTYNWTVSSTVSTEVSVTVSGTDLAGIAYSGTDSLTFNIAVLPDYLPANGLMAWYPFNGNATDESGNGNDGTNYDIHCLLIEVVFQIHLTHLTDLVLMC